MKSFLLTIDLEDFHVDELGGKNKDSNLSLEGLQRVLSVLDRYDIKATFFVTLPFAKKNKQLIKELIKKGHEIASHGYDHSHRYKVMNKKESLDYLTKSRKELEKLFKIKIEGFRAPQMSHPDYDVIKNAGFEYDSSCHPTFLPGYYFNLFMSRKITKKGKLVVVPVSVAPFVRLPFSWLWFRFFGLWYTKLCSNLCFLVDEYINIYFHPWDFADIHRVKELWWLIKRNSGEKAIKKLNKYILWLRKKKVRFITVSEYLKNG